MLIRTTLLSLVAATVFPVAATVYTSPDGEVSADVSAGAEGLVAAVSCAGRVLATVELSGPVLYRPFEGGFAVEKVDAVGASTSWKPVWGDRAEVRDAWNGAVYTLREQGGARRALQVEVRAYGEGFAARYVLPFGESEGEWDVLGERTAVHYPAGAAAWAIHGTEDTFPEAAIPLKDLKGRNMLPLTVEVPGAGVCSLLEAHCVHYARVKAESLGADGVRLAVQGSGSSKGRGRFEMPWRALVCAPNAARLIENATLVLNLNPPCAIADTSWIKPGITVSNEGNCQILQDRLEEVGELAARGGFKYLQIDWGWYGTEWAWTEKEREQWAKLRPDLASDPDWRRNTAGRPWGAAKGLVPYHPAWKDNVTRVDLDIPRLVSFLKARGMGLCLYVNDSTLRADELDALFAEYEKWGLAGLKPGFVRYGDAASTDWNRRLVETAAKHRLWLCIHDAHVPDGMERTYPNLMLCEGGGGQEGNHPVRQDVTLPFTRCLAGPFDFTPTLFDAKKTHCHAVAFLLAYPGPSAVLRGRTDMQFSEKGGPGAFGPELEFVKRLPMTYDETRVLDAKIGGHLVVARRKGGVWFLAGMTGAAPHTAKIDLGRLGLDAPGRLTLFRDGEGAGNACPAVRETRTVGPKDALEVPMSAAGGFVAILER